MCWYSLCIGGRSWTISRWPQCSYSSGSFENQTLLIIYFPLPRPWLAPWNLLNSCPSLRLLNTSFLKCYASAVPLSKTDKVCSQGADLETVCLFTRNVGEWICGITTLFWDQHLAGPLSHRAPPKSFRSLVSIAIRACSVVHSVSPLAFSTVNHQLNLLEIV